MQRIELILIALEDFKSWRLFGIEEPHFGYQLIEYNGLRDALLKF